MFYDPKDSLRAARDRYLTANDFDASYDDAWVCVQFGPLPLVFPNSAARKRAVRFHDLHHIVTGYETTLIGEFEISAWELGSGCADMLAAWQLNLSGLFAGLLLSPRRIVRAFGRGRRSRNFYRHTYDDALLDRTVGEARRELGLEPAPPTTLSPTDKARLLLYAAGGLVSTAALFSIMIPLLPVGVTLSFMKPRQRMAGT